MKKLIITMLALVASATIMAVPTKSNTDFNLRLSSFTELDKGHRTSVGLTLDVVRYERLSAGVFGGFDSDIWLNTLRGPGQKNWFDGQPVTVGPVLNYTVANWHNVTLGVSGGYLGTMRTIETPRNGKWVVGLSLGINF